MIYVIGPKDSVKGKTVISTVSRAKGWSRGLSPFFLGPCKLYGDYVSKNMENAWQFSKVYPYHVDDNGDPTEDYFKWAEKGWNDSRAHRYPMGKGNKPLYSYWDGEKLPYVEARKRIYIPLYWNAVKHTAAFQTLKMVCDCEVEDTYLWDFDGYNHKELGMSYEDVVNCETRKAGHAFVLAMALDGCDKYLV